MTLFYAVALLIAFYLLLVAEFFLPAGGMLGTASVAALIAALVIAFSHSILAGMVMVFVVSVTTPIVVFALLRVWPHTPLGRRMLNRRPGQQTSEPPKRTTSSGIPIDELVGHIGTARTDLLPSGRIEIDGEKLDAVSTGMPIDAGTHVIVTSVDVGRIHVRAATDGELARDSGQATPPQSPPSLEESLESFDAE